MADNEFLDLSNENLSAVLRAAADAFDRCRSERHHARGSANLASTQLCKVTSAFAQHMRATAEAAHDATREAERKARDPSAAGMAETDRGDWVRAWEAEGAIAERDAEIAKLRHELSAEDRSHTGTIVERDRLSDAIQATHIALGGDGECAAGETGDLAIDVPALARERVSEIANLRKVADAAREYLAAEENSDFSQDLNSIARGDEAIGEAVDALREALAEAEWGQRDGGDHG